MNRKTYNKINFVLIILLVGVFFFQIFPTPCENIEGSKLEDKYIFGGFAYTSIMNEFLLGNYMGSSILFLTMLIPLIGNKVFYEVNKKDGDSEQS